MNEPFDLIGLLVILLAVACGVLLLMSRLRLPPVIGYLVSGVLVGPHVFGHLTESVTVSSLAEIGVLLLMFTIGLEFDTQYFLRIRRVAIGGGALQIGLTLLAAAGLGALAGWPLRTSMTVGCLIALSSTAVVLKSLMDLGLLDSLAGRISLGILIFQDLSVVPMMIVLPVSGDSPAVVLTNLAAALGRAGFLLAVALFLSRRAMPKFLHLMAKTRSQETVLLVTLTLCLSMAWVSHLFGVSYALGAFLGGLILGGSEYAHQMKATVIPFRDVFAGVFFVAMGMLLDPQYALQEWRTVLGVTILIVVGKSLITAASIAVFGFPWAVALQTGINLAQVGEFSFLLALVARSAGILTDDMYKVAVAASVLTMMLAPPLTRFSPRLASRLARGRGWLPAWERLARRYERGVLDVQVAGEKAQGPQNHVVVLGYGSVGRALGDVLRSNSVPFVGLEIDPDLVRDARRRGHPVLYGDAGSEELLERCGARQARHVLVTLPDPLMARHVIRLVRRMNPGLFVLARGRRAVEDEPLYKEGADEVIHETFEVGIEFIARLLRRLNVPKQEIERQVGRVRSGRYEVFRRRDFAPLPLADVRRALDSLRVEFLEIPPGSPLAGRTLRDAGIREATGALVVAVGRDGDIVHAPDSHFELQSGDTILVAGAAEQVSQVEGLVEPVVAAGETPLRSSKTEA
jgi:CPA2 family monovalent cation:H+ antiporter-2